MSVTRASKRPQTPSPFRFRKGIILGALCAVAFGATYAVVSLTKGSPPSPPGMVWIPGGEFTMGTDSDLGWADEKPAHRVKVNGFYMDRAEPEPVQPDQQLSGGRLQCRWH